MSPENEVMAFIVTINQKSPFLCITILMNYFLRAYLKIKLDSTSGIKFTYLNWKTVASSL